MFAHHHDPIPPRLEQMQPGPVLAGFLASIDVSRMSGHDRVIVLCAHQRMASHSAAHVCGDIAAVGDALENEEEDADPLWAAEAAAAEIRAAAAHQTCCRL
jgi:hypothetical protein